MATFVRMGVFYEGGKCLLGMPDGTVCELSGRVEQLHVEVVEARGLPVMDVGEGMTEEERDAGIGVTCDAFCKFSLGDTERRSKVVSNTLDPVWKESFLFTITDPRDERGEMFRQLTDMKVLKLSVYDWDPDGSEDFVGKIEVPVSNFQGDDPQGRSVFVDGWYDLLAEDGSKPRVRKDNSPGKGSIHLRCAMRVGIQVENMNRLRGADWINPSKFIEALETLPNHFCPGDEQVVDAVCSLIRRRFERPDRVPEHHLTMLRDYGVPLGLAMHKGPRLDFAKSETPLGGLLSEMMVKNVSLESTFKNDPRDVHFPTMSTHWPARLAAIKAIGHFVSREDSCSGQVVDSLMTMVADESAIIRVAAMQVITKLCEMEDPRIVRHCTDALSDAHRAVRKAAIEGLGIICRKNDPVVVVDACHLLDDKRSEMRACAKKALQAIVTKGSTLAIIEVCARLESPSSTVRLAAVSCLSVVAGKGDKKCIVEVVNRLQHPVQAVRIVALEAISIVAERGDRFALAAVSNLMTHPDWEVRRVASAGVQVLAKKADLAAMQSVVRLIALHSESDAVIEAAKYVRMPTATRASGWKDPQSQQGNVMNERDNVVACDVFTPRAEHFLPIKRHVAVSVHIPLIPSDPCADTVAHLWWQNKHADDLIRHRYEWPSFGRVAGAQISMESQTSLSTDQFVSISRSRSYDRSSSGTETLGRDSRLSIPSHPISNSRTHLPSRRKVATREQLRTDKLMRDKELVLGVCKGILLESDDVKFPSGPAFIDAVTTVVSAQIELKDFWRWDLIFPLEANQEIDFAAAKLAVKYSESKRSDLLRAAEIIAAALGQTIEERIDSNLPSSISDRGETAATTLRVTVHSAEHLSKVADSLDPFVSLEVPGGQIPVRTRVKMNFSEPIWDETFSIVLTERMIRAVLPNVDKFENDEIVGCGRTLETPGGTDGSAVGLYYDTLLSLPLTKSELASTADLKSFREALSLTALQPDADCVEVLSQSQIGPRTREVVVRIHTGDFLETLSMGDRVKGAIVGKEMYEKSVIDENRIDLVSADPITTPEMLQQSSMPLVCKIWHYRLSQNPILLGNVILPLGPLVNTMRKNSGEKFEHSFEVRDEMGQLMYHQGSQCQLRLSFTLDGDARDMIKTTDAVAYCREKEHMADVIRSVAIETLQSISSGAVEMALTELLNCCKSTSGDVHRAAEQCVQRLARPPHAAGITGVTWWGAESSERVVTCSEDGTLKIWRTSDWFMEETMVGHESRGAGCGVRSIASKCGRVVSGGADGTVRVWDMVSREERALLPDVAPTIVNCVTLSKSGRLLLAGGGGMLSSGGLGWNEDVVDVGHDACIHAWRLIPMIESSVINVDGIAGDGISSVVSEEHLRLAQTLAGCYQHSHTDQAFKIAMPLIERIVLWGGSSSLVQSKLPGQLPLATTEIARAALAKFSKDLTLVERPTEYPPWMRTLAIRIRRERRNMRCLHVQQIPFSDNALLSGWGERSSNSPAMSRSSSILIPLAPPRLGTPLKSVKSGGNSRKGTALKSVKSGGDSRSIQSGGASAGVPKSAFPARVPAAEPGSVFDDVYPTSQPADAVLCLDADPMDESCFASSGDDGVVRVWKLGGIEDLGPVAGRDVSVRDHASGQAQPAVQTHEMREHSTRVRSVKYHPQVQGVLFSASRSILAWNLSTKSSILALAAPPAGGMSTCMDITTKGTMVAAGFEQGRMRVWDINIVRSGVSKKIVEYETSFSVPRELLVNHRAEVTCLSFNSSGTLCASASLDRTSIIFDPQTCKALRVLSGDPLPLGIRQGVCASALAKGLEQQDEKVREGANLLLPFVSEWGDPGSTLEVARKLGHPRSDVRAAALNLLNQITGPEAENDAEVFLVVAKLLLHSNHDIRTDAQRGMELLLPTDPHRKDRFYLLSERLVARMFTQGDSVLTIAADVLLPLGGQGGLGEERLVYFLRSWDTEKEWGTRLVKLEGFVNVGVALQHGDVKTLAGLVAHPDPHVREMAGDAAATMAEGSTSHGMQALAYLIPMSSSGPFAVMIDARRAVSRLLSAILLRDASF